MLPPWGCHRLHPLMISGYHGEVDDRAVQGATGEFSRETICRPSSVT